MSLGFAANFLHFKLSKNKNKVEMLQTIIRHLFAFVVLTISDVRYFGNTENSGPVPRWSWLARDWNQSNLCWHWYLLWPKISAPTISVLTRIVYQILCCTVLANWIWYRENGSEWSCLPQKNRSFATCTVYLILQFETRTESQNLGTIAGTSAEVDNTGTVGGTGHH